MVKPLAQKKDPTSHDGFGHTDRNHTNSQRKHQQINLGTAGILQI